MKVSDTKLHKCLAETYKHVKQVNQYIHLFIHELLDRADNHDDSKFEDPELSIFAEFTGELEKTSYYADNGKDLSEEYQSLLKEVQPAIEHHYACNRHHTEHWPEGIDDMTLIDLLEMLGDWCAATKRNKNGNIRKSIEVNAERYKLSPQLVKIFENTVRELFQD